MEHDADLAAAAQLFKVLGSEPRLAILRHIADEACAVGHIAEVTSLSQPLVSQHLRTLRQAGLVTATRSGKEVLYELADQHVRHVVADVLVHVTEPSAHSPATSLPNSPTDSPKETP